MEEIYDETPEDTAKIDSWQLHVAPILDYSKEMPHKPPEDLIKNTDSSDDTNNVAICSFGHTQAISINLSTNSPKNVPCGEDDDSEYEPYDYDYDEYQNYDNDEDIEASVKFNFG